MFIFDKTEPHILISAFTEPEAGRHRHFRLAEQKFRKFQRSQSTVGKWNPGPDKHRRDRLIHLPSNTVEPAHQHIATLLISQDSLFHTVLRPIEGNDTG